MSLTRLDRDPKGTAANDEVLIDSPRRQTDTQVSPYLFLT